MHFSSNNRWEIRTTPHSEGCGLGHSSMITTYNIAVTDVVRYLGRIVAGKSPWSPEMFSISVMRGEIKRRSSTKAEGTRNTGKQTRIQKAVKKVKEG